MDKSETCQKSKTKGILTILSLLVLIVFIALMLVAMNKEEFFLSPLTAFIGVCISLFLFFLSAFSMTKNNNSSDRVKKARWGSGLVGSYDTGDEE